MRQLFLDKRNLVAKQVAQPLLDDYSILVAVHYAYISDSTQIKQLDTQEHFLTNVPHKVKRVLQAVSSHAQSETKTFTGLGYPCTGQVVSVGKKVQHFAPGDLVACADPGYVTHADLICIPANHAVKISDPSHTKAASLTTFAAVALHGVRRANLHLGQRVAIIGLGMLGQFAVQLAKLAGCEIIAIDDVPDRLLLARECGADYTLHRLQDDIVKEIALLTEHKGVDALLVTVPDNLQTLLQLAKPNGRMVLLGVSDLQIPSDAINNKEQELILIPASGHDQIPYEYLKISLSLIEAGKLQVTSLIKEEVAIHQLTKQYQRIENKNILGLLLAYDRHIQQISPVTSCTANLTIDPSIRFMPAVSDTIRVGVIGAGEHTKETLLPLIAGLRTTKINALLDTDVQKATQLAAEFNIPKTYTKDTEFFADSALDAIVIASAHVLHSEQAIKALAHGKAIFIEKPMVTDIAQLRRLCTLLEKNTFIPFCVDYHRSFSPFIQKIKSVVAKRNTPLMMNYRVNCAHASAQWIQTNGGSGRIIGDACQIIDLFCYLADTKPISVSVEAMHAARDDIFPTDNFTVHISFDDGSVGSLLFTSLGHPDMGTERFELFFDEKAVLMEDFMELYGFGLPSWFSETHTSADNGQEHLLRQFFYALQQKPFVPPIPLERLHIVAELTLLIDQLACEGGGNKEL